MYNKVFFDDIKHLETSIKQGKFYFVFKSFSSHFVSSVLAWNKVQNLTKKFNLRRYVLSCSKTASIKFKECRGTEKCVKTWQITNVIHAHTNECSCKCWLMVNIKYKNSMMRSMNPWLMFLYFVVQSFSSSSSQRVDKSLFERKDSVIR